MNKIGIQIDYGNICQDYNTAYLDRDNKDPATAKCMKAVTAWVNGFLDDLLPAFGFSIYQLNSGNRVDIDEVASNRFLFYSLEKEIMLQSFVIQKDAKAFDTIHAWDEESGESILLQNDEDGEGIYFYFEKESAIHHWMTQKLQDFSADEIPFPAK